MDAAILAAWLGRPHPVGEAAVRITVGGVALGGDLATLPQTGRHRAVRARQRQHRHSHATHGPPSGCSAGSAPCDGPMHRRRGGVDRCSRELRFDIGLLARRLLGPVDCLPTLLGSGELRVGLFGASTDAAAMRLATGHRLRSCPAPDIRSGEPGALDKVARLAAAWFVTYRR